MIKTKYWIIILAVLLLISGGLTLWQFSRSGDGTVAVITQDGKEIERIDLSKVKAPYEFTVAAPDGGSNTVSVEPGRIRVSHADCPDLVCVNGGWISDGTFPIVCLPHRLVVSIEGGSQDIADIKAG